METPLAPRYNEPETYPQTTPPSCDQSRITRSQAPAPYFPQNAPGYGYNQPVDQYVVLSTPVSNRSQQQSNFVITQPGIQGATVANSCGDPMPNLNRHIVFSCIVAWCFCLIFGVIAFIIANNASQASTAAERRGKGKLSLGFSLAGFVIGVSAYIGVITFQEVYYHQN